MAILPHNLSAGGGGKKKLIENINTPKLPYQKQMSLHPQKGPKMALTPKQLKTRLESSIIHWRNFPIDWVKDKFKTSLRSNKIVLSTQQLEYFDELGKLSRAKQQLRVEKRGGVPKWDATIESYRTKIGISIMAGKGVGKDFITAMTVLWMIDCFPNCKVPCTGANAKHLRNVLWAEISKVASLSEKINENDPISKTVLQGILNFGVERIERKDNPAQWFAEALTINRNSTKDEQALTVQGRHADAMMFVVDEACSTPDIIFPKIEETLTDPFNFMLMIFNPDRTRSYAIKTHYDPTVSDKFVKLRWNAEESELVTREHIDNIARQGRDSRAYRVGVLGLPPLVDSNTLIVPDWVFDAVGRDVVPSDYDPIIAGVDVGGGGDKSVICFRQGGKVIGFEYNSDKNLMDVAAWVKVRMDVAGARAAFVDAIGLGQGVYDQLQKMGAVVRAVDNRSKATREDKYFNKRSECYMRLREAFQNNLIGMPEDVTEDLKEELNSITFDAERRNKIGDKNELRKIIGRSPDEADALALTYAYDHDAYRQSRFNTAYKVDYSRFCSGVI